MLSTTHSQDVVCLVLSQLGCRGRAEVCCSLQESWDALPRLQGCMQLLMLSFELGGSSQDSYRPWPMYGKLVLSHGPESQRGNLTALVCPARPLSTDDPPKVQPWGCHLQHAGGRSMDKWKANKSTGRSHGLRAGSVLGAHQSPNCRKGMERPFLSHLWVADSVLPRSLSLVSCRQAQREQCAQAGACLREAHCSCSWVHSAEPGYCLKASWQETLKLLETPPLLILEEKPAK